MIRTDNGHEFQVKFHWHCLDQGIASIAATSYRESEFNAGQFIGQAARGTKEAPLPVRKGDFLASFNGRGYGGTAFSNRPRGRFGVVAAEDWTEERQGANLSFWTTEIGTNQASEKMMISPEGNIGIGTSDPKSKLHVDGGIQVADEIGIPGPEKVGTLRYRADSNNSHVEMCMQVGAGAYAWVTIKQFSW